MDGYGSSKPIPKQDGQEEGQDKYQLEQELAQVLREAEETEREEQAREKEESPDWDGSEAEYVPDDDAEEYEELSPGIGLNYVLRPEEVYECLKHIIPVSYTHLDVYKRQARQAGGLPVPQPGRDRNLYRRGRFRRRVCQRRA